MTARYASVHSDPQGPDDARPTALQIIKDENLTGALVGKTVFVTGCSSGVGVETAKAMFTTGATLYLTARDLAKARKALGEIADKPNVHLLHLDLDSFASVRKCASEFMAASSSLNILICNAGVMNPPFRLTEDGFESQLSTNHLAHFLLSYLLTPLLLSSATPDFPSRNIIITSVGHHACPVNSVDFGTLKETSSDPATYDDFYAYARSKLLSFWTSNAINRYYGAQDLISFSVQPGAVVSDLTRHFSEEQKDFHKTDEHLRRVFKSAEQGAATGVWGAVASLDGELGAQGRGGRYLEDCAVANEWVEAEGIFRPGYASWGYNEDMEDRTWEWSKKMCGLLS